MDRRNGLAWLGLLLAATACAPTTHAPEPTPAGGPREEARLPPIPFREGPLDLQLVYPPDDGDVTVRDSTFVFGSTGTGLATLTINGVSVPVQPNGTFLAFLPVPRDSIYHLEATSGTSSARLERRVGVPLPPPSPAPGEALIVEGSVSPRGGWSALPGERIEVRFHGSAGGRATLLLPDGSRIPLPEEGPVLQEDAGNRVFDVDPEEIQPQEEARLARYSGYFPARPLLASDPDAQPTLVPAGGPSPVALPDAAGDPTVAGAVDPPRGANSGAAAGTPVEGEHGEAVIELVLARDTARVPLPLTLALLDPARPPVGIALEEEPYPESSGRTPAAWGPGNTFDEFWPNLTELTITGERDDAYRVRLGPELDAWVEADNVRLLPDGTPPPGGRVGAVRFTSHPEEVDVHIDIERRFPFRIQPRERSLEITIYGGIADTDWIMYGSLDPYIKSARWAQPADSIYRLDLQLEAPPWGYRAFWDSSGNLVVRLRRPPRLDQFNPLQGLTIAVDPGHPPGGAIGPTGLTEADATLAVASRLRPLLEQAGARVVMTRTDTATLGLYERTMIAEQADAHLFVSIHFNAFPDGVDPFVNNGTSTYYFHPHSLDLAKALQGELLHELRLRDLGIGRSSLAVVRRLEWMPAALTETLFMMIPQQEAALRDPQVQERIARAHLRAIETFLRGRAVAAAAEGPR